jgi:ABC-type multidrug transport system fused ATPase/permease subunit
MEQGAHEDLLARGGLYAKLYAEQFLSHHRSAESVGS